LQARPRFFTRVEQSRYWSGHRSAWRHRPRDAGEMQMADWALATVSLGWRWAALVVLAATVLPAHAAPPAAQCPQPRFTGQAPEDYYSRTNPLQPDAGNLAAGEQLYLGKTSDPGCAICHGDRGEGNGPLATQFRPPPRNFACAKTVNDIPDGQLFWIIRFGSPGTSMPPHPKLTDEQIWQTVLHLRRLAK
jgi:mono/diheme cytochrome c family protein